MPWSVPGGRCQPLPFMLGTPCCLERASGFPARMGTGNQPPKAGPPEHGARGPGWAPITSPGLLRAGHQLWALTGSRADIQGIAGHSHTGPLQSSSWWAWLSLSCGIPGQSFHEIQVYTETWHQRTNKRGYLLHLIIRGPAHLPPELYPPQSLGGHLDLGSHTPGVTGGSHCSRFLSEEILRTCHRGKGPDMDSSY